MAFRQEKSTRPFRSSVRLMAVDAVGIPAVIRIAGIAIPIDVTVMVTIPIRVTIMVAIRIIAIVMIRRSILRRATGEPDSKYQRHNEKLRCHVRFLQFVFATPIVAKISALALGLLSA